MFTPLETYLGAILINCATSSYLLTTGNTIGFSSILFNLLNRISIHNVSIILGLFIAAYLTTVYLTDFVPVYNSDVPVLKYIISGGLVGLGTQLGRGCTSGHMINGLSRLRWRSLVATMTFVSVAIFTTFILDLGSPCEDYCYHYDPLFTRFNNNMSFLGLVTLYAFASSYVILPIFTSKLALLAPNVVQIVNGLNAGMLFGLGLVISGMVQPSKTLGFLSILNLKKFDPSLALILLCCILPNVFLWNGSILTREKSLSGRKFDLNNDNDTPLKFIIGNAIFGVGWGSLGICPGPGIMGLFFNGINGVSWLVSFWICYKLSTLIF